MNLEGALPVRRPDHVRDRHRLGLALDQRRHVDVVEHDEAVAPVAVRVEMLVGGDRARGGGDDERGERERLAGLQLVLADHPTRARHVHLHEPVHHVTAGADGQRVHDGRPRPRNRLDLIALLPHRRPPYPAESRLMARWTASRSAFSRGSSKR